MPALPYAVVYIDRDLTELGLTNYLNLQWRDGWEYVSHLSDPGPKQALLMKKRDYPEPYRVLAALMSLWDSKHMTMDELFASFIAILSDDPLELPAVRAALEDKADVRDLFEGWLRGLKERPTIMMSSGKRIDISDELLEALAEEEKK